MNRKSKTFSHEQLSYWLNEGLEIAQIGLAVFDEYGEVVYENLHCKNKGHCPFFNGNSGLKGKRKKSGVEENVIQTGKGEWIKTIRRFYPDSTSICACVSLSDMKLKEFSGSDNEKKYRLLADNTLDVIWLMDVNLKFMYVSPAVEQMLGFTSEEWIGSDLSEHCEEEEMHRMAVIVSQAMARADKKPWVLFETELLTKNNISVPVEILAKFMFDKNGEITGIQGTTRDIRERKEFEATRKEMETLLVQAQKFEALGALAGGIAHDFNNILSAIIGFSGLALADAPADSDQFDNISQVLVAGERARELVMQILSFSRKKSSEPQPVMVDRVVKEVVKLLQASLPPTITIESNSSQNSYVMADPIQLHQILMNLCTNALHAMGDADGVLGIEVKRLSIDKNGWDKSRKMPRGDYVMIAVSDTGTGISDNFINKIFEPFFTTKPEGKGTGIGLSVVKNIIHNLKGSIEVDSRPEKGTVFTVYLPSVQEEPKSHNISEELLVGGTESVMFVDDEPSISALGEQILRRMGYRVTAFVDSHEALEWFNENYNDCDLVITDVMMSGITGDELASHVLSLRPDIPVVICTGYTERLTPESARDLGVKAFLRKPVSRAELVTTVRDVLDGESLL